MSQLLQTVQQIYAAFGQGNIPAIIDQLDDAVQWEAWEDNHAQAAGVPWLRAGVGKPAAMRFIEEVGRMTFEHFSVLDLLASGRQVAAEVVVQITLPNGRRLRDEEMHLWPFNDQGKVVRFRHYADTAKQAAACG
jgi:uncharacterized protein